MNAAPDRILPGVALMIGFCVIAPLIDVFAKLASQEVSVGTVTFFRFVVQGALMLPVVLAMRLRMAMTPRVLRLALLRAAVSILSTYTFVAAVQVMPLADALAIVFVEPFILLLLGRWLFGDQVGPRRILACLVGFAGALLVIQPSLQAFGLVALWPLGTAFSFAFYMLVTRSVSDVMHPVAMQAHTSWIGVAICLPVVWLMNDGPLPALDSVMPLGLAMAVAVRRGVLGGRQPPVHDLCAVLCTGRHAGTAALPGNRGGGGAGLSDLRRSAECVDLGGDRGDRRFGPFRHPP